MLVIKCAGQREEEKMCWHSERASFSRCRLSQCRLNMDSNRITAIGQQIYAIQSVDKTR